MNTRGERLVDFFSLGHIGNLQRVEVLAQSELELDGVVFALLDLDDCTQDPCYTTNRISNNVSYIWRHPGEP